MTDEKITEAIAEAKRFIHRAEVLQARRKKDTWLKQWDASREGGACRRASMDLTRALADLRRPGQ